MPSLLERGRARASAEGLKIAFRVADAEALPFDDGTFDAVVSTFGVMFTPDQDRAASELLRVCKDGGQIGLANWTPDGFVGQMFKTLGKYLPPPAGAKSPIGNIQSENYNPPRPFPRPSWELPALGTRGVCRTLNLPRISVLFLLGELIFDPADTHDPHSAVPKLESEHDDMGQLVGHSRPLCHD